MFTNSWLANVREMVREPKYQLRFFFDPGSGCCFRAANDAARERFGYAVEARQLPLPENTRRRTDYVVSWYDTCTDWDNPPGPSPWDSDECQRFNAVVAQLLDMVEHQLGPEYQVVNEFVPMSSDP